MQAHSTEPAVETDVLVVTDIRDQRVDQLAHEASVLVLGAYGGGGQVALSLGSTSDALSRAFTCPILLTHARVGESLRAGTRPPTVVAAVSRDDTAQHVVAVAAREAAERHTPLLIVHAIPMQDAAQVPAEHDWIAAVVAGAGVPSWLPHRTVVTVADPTAAVLDRVEPDDLLVVATRGEGRLAGLVAGSVTRALLDAGPCDVLVVSHGATHPTSGLTSPPAQVRTPTDTVTLTDTECWSLLRSAAVGRLGVTVKGRPDIFPVNHVVHSESIVFRTRRDRSSTPAWTSRWPTRSTGSTRPPATPGASSSRAPPRTYANATRSCGRCGCPSRPGPATRSRGSSRSTRTPAEGL